MSHISKDNAVQKLLAKYQKVDYKEILRSVILENEKALCDILREQLRMGKAGSGDITPGYSPAYLNYKRSLASYRAGNKPDWYLTGAFQAAIYLLVQGTKYEFDSKDSKRVELYEKYSDDPMNLNQLSKELAHELITPLFFKAYQK